MRQDCKEELKKCNCCPPCQECTCKASHDKPIVSDSYKARVMAAIEKSFRQKGR